MTKIRSDLKDISGIRFGSRVAISYVGHKKWLTRCDCGREIIVDGADLRRRNYLCTHQRYSRFLAKIKIENGCWIWMGSKNEDGYGCFRGGFTGSAHIYSWITKNGHLPEGKELDHLCRNRACVNPEHLEPVTHAENVRRGDLKYVSKRRFGKII